MGLVEIIGGSVTAPGSTETALTPFTGQTFQVRDFKGSEKAKLLATWNFVQGTGISKFRSARLHDNVQNFRIRTIANAVFPTFLGSDGQTLVTNDLLLPTLSGSATAGDIEQAYYLVYYSSLEGVNSRFTHYNSISRRIKNLLTVEVSLTAGTTGGFSGTKNIVADYDLLKSGTDYAVLGYRSSVLQGAISLYGIDTGNLKTGGPGSLASSFDTSNWFKQLSLSFDIDCVPILNSNNKTSIYVETSNNENAASPIVTLFLAELY
ncbi:MAG: hypothetical protein GYA50_08085 [Eubacteriaceae bacterium]|nr:hypothetical protein [Eubacteriaceae bacterium]